MPITAADVEAAAAEAIAASTGPASLATGLTAALGRLVLRNSALVERRLAALESKRAMVFEGPHDPGRQYSPGHVVQRANGLWVCLVSTAETPGQSAHWRQVAACR